MVKKKWYAQRGTERIKVIEGLDSGSQRIWIKFEPTDKTKPLEVCNILDQPDKVSWEYKNSHFETIDRNRRTNYYAASTAGSFRCDAGTTDIFKDSGSKVIVFPLNLSGSINVCNYTQAGNQFQISVSKPMWIGYAISGSGTLSLSKR